MPAERPQPTPEIPVNPAEVLQGLQQNRVFENRLMGNFFEAKVDPSRVQATQKGRIVTLDGQVTDSPLTIKIDSAFNVNSWRLLVQNRQRDPDPERHVAQVHHGNGLGVNGEGGLEGGWSYSYRLNHPDAEGTLKLLSELAGMDKQSRSVQSLLEGYPDATKDPLAVAYVGLVDKFADPSRLRLTEGYFNTPPESLAGVIDDPRLHLPGEIYVNFHGRNALGRDKTPHCWVHWFGDKGEDYKYPLQTVFEFRPEDNSFAYADNTANIRPGTVRYELSEQMLSTLNEGLTSPASSSQTPGLRERFTGFLHRPQQA